MKGNRHVRRAGLVGGTIALDLVRRPRGTWPMSTVTACGMPPTSTRATSSPSRRAPRAAGRTPRRSPPAGSSAQPHKQPGTGRVGDPGVGDQRGWSRGARAVGHYPVGRQWPTIPINIADCVGRTPMVQLTRLAARRARRELFAKLEMFNPGGSVKDRIGVAMIEAAEAEGRIEPGRTTIVEATSGNTGIALAFVCAAKGYDLILTLPQGMSREREGAAAPLRRAGPGHRVAGRDERGGRRRAGAGARRRLLAARPVLQPGQPRGALPRHRPGDLGGARRRVDCLVAGVGTGGTITGAGGFLKERNPKLRWSRVEPAASPVLSGGRPGRTRSRASARASSRRCSTASCSTR